MSVGKGSLAIAPDGATEALNTFRGHRGCGGTIALFLLGERWALPGDDWNCPSPFARARGGGVLLHRRKVDPLTPTLSRRERERRGGTSLRRCL
jgi:hypothetical protein